MLWFIDSCQNKVSTDPVSRDPIAGSGVELIKVAYFFKVDGCPGIGFRLNRKLQLSYYSREEGQGTSKKTKFRRELTPGALLTFLPRYSLHNRLLEYCVCYFLHSWENWVPLLGIVC